MAAAAFCLTASAVRSEVYEEEGKTHSIFSFSKPAKDNPRDQMRYAQEHLENGRQSKAGKAFRSLVITWPGSAEAPLAQWAYARILDAEGKQLKAFDEYQKLMENYTGRFPHYEQALARQFAIATNVMVSKKGGFLFFGGFEAPERAIPLLEKVIENGPRSAYAPQAQYLIGEARELSFDYDLAVVAYISALHRYPLSDVAEEAAFGRARSLNKISRNYPNDQQALSEAWAGIMVFLRAYPDSTYREDAAAIRDELLERKAEHAFKIAQFYDTKQKRRKAAIEAYRNFITEYPNSKWTEEARGRMMELTSEEPQS